MYSRVYILTNSVFLEIWLQPSVLLKKHATAYAKI